MPDLIRFSDLKDSQPLTLNGNNDLFAIAVKNDSSETGYTSMTVKPNVIAGYVAEDATYVNLKTGASDNTVVKAINKTLENFADEFNTTAGSTYAKDECVIYEGVLYQCSNASGTTSGTFVTADWTQIKAVDVGSGGGSSGDHITLTQDEYDALVQAGTVDPDAYYFISDAVFPSYAHEYSTNEQIVGTWIDGSPVYEKTLIFNNKLVTNDNSTCELVHGISNLGTVSFIVGAYYDFTSGGTAWATGTNAVFNYRVVWKIGSTSIHMTDVDQLSFSASPDRYYMFVIRYTKSSS